jgi:hypothetical protein
MSMQISVLSDKQLASTAEWQQAIDAESFPLRLQFEEPLAQIKGFVGAELGKTQTGFECHHQEPADIIDAYPDVKFDHAWKYGLAFTWGGDIDALQAAWTAAAAYARVTDGVLFDESDGRCLSPEEAIIAARDLEHTAPEAKALVLSLIQQIHDKQ